MTLCQWPQCCGLVIPSSSLRTLWSESSFSLNRKGIWSPRSFSNLLLVNRNEIWIQVLLLLEVAVPRLEDICVLDRADSDHDVLWLTITSNAALQSITRMIVEVEKGKQRYLPTSMQTGWEDWWMFLCSSFEWYGDYVSLGNGNISVTIIFFCLWYFHGDLSSSISAGKEGVS